LIPGEKLERFFEAWREGVQNVNQGDGVYIDSETIYQCNAYPEVKYKKLSHMLSHQMTC
jgi:hypothetical protein